jgi:hypothetical protein
VRRAPTAVTIQLALIQAVISNMKSSPVPRRHLLD